MSMENFTSRLIEFNLKTGLSPDVPSLKRHLSNMRGMFNDENALTALISKEDSLIYEFYDLGIPENSGQVNFGTSITYPGKVGNEYFMTKGHFHKVLDTAEVYYTLSGHGYMLMENPEGDWEARELVPGKAIYIQGRYAHRSINVSPDQPLVTFFAFPGHAGHDYGTIETKGFRKLLVDIDGKPEFIDNPRWKG